MTATQAGRIVRVTLLALCGSVVAAAGCSQNPPSNPRDAGVTGGNRGSGGATGSGGVSASGGARATGGTSGTGGAVGSGGSSLGTGGTLGGGGLGTGGDAGAGGVSEGTGGMGGMPLLISCDVSQARAAGMVIASSRFITDFTYPDPAGRVAMDSFSFGDYTDTPSGYGYHYPRQPAGVDTGGMGGDTAGGAGGIGGEGGTASAGGRGGAGGRGAGGAGGRGGAGGAVVPLGPPYIFEDFTGSDWHVTGVVATYAAVVAHFVCITDASAFPGIEFTIRGNAGSPNRVSLQAFFSADEPGSRVTPSLGMCEGACRQPSTMVDVTPTRTLVQIPWSRFTGGLPVPSVNPAQLFELRWSFTWSPSATPYPVDISIDDLQFMAPVVVPADAGAPDAASAD